MSKEDVLNYIKNTTTASITGNANHYQFNTNANSLILLSKECYERLTQLTNLSAFRVDEHNTFLFGLELNPNTIYFYAPDTSRDYEPHHTEVSYGEQQSREITQAINNHSDNKPLVVCGLHTHPYGVLKNPDGSPSLQNNFFSYGDLDVSIKFHTILNNHAQEQGKHIRTFAGLIAIDNANGNSLISFIENVNNVSFCRFNNVKVVEKMPNGQFVVIKDLHENGLDYIETNFGMDKKS